MNPQFQKAVQLHQNGQFHEAESEYKQILESQPDNVQLYNYLADALNRQGKLQETAQLLKDAAERFPTNLFLKVTLGQTLLGLGHIEEASDLAIGLQKDFPRSGEVFYFSGNLYMQQGRGEEALAAFEKAVNIIPQLTEAQFNIGALLYQKRDLDGARKRWQKCVQQQAAFTPALLNLGNLELEAGRYEEALNYLSALLKQEPDHSYAHKLSGMAKHYLGERDEALEHYNRVFNTEGPGEEIHTLIGNVNRDMNRMEEAVNHYEKALTYNAESKIARENLDKISSSKIEGWHFDMLGDLKRNEGYDEAIKRVIRGGETVLDIGTGSGLLSMMCARAGARHVYTCETIQAIAQAAQQVISDNGYAGTISIIPKQSNSLKIGQEIPAKVDVLVSEVLDSGLLGEGVLPTVRHAREKLLKEGGRIIPAAATVKGMLIESNHLHAIAPLDHISGFDLRSFGRFQVKDVYRRETLNNVPYKSISKEFKVLDIDFYNLPPAVAPEAPNRHTLEVEISHDGELHAVAFWFDLHLDEQLSLSSGPEGEMIHWGQAVYSLNPVRKVKAGDRIKLVAEQSEMKIVFSL